MNRNEYTTLAITQSDVKLEVYGSANGGAGLYLQDTMQDDGLCINLSNRQRLIVINALLLDNEVITVGEDI